MNPPEWIVKARNTAAQAGAKYEQLQEQALVELAKVTGWQTLATYEGTAGGLAESVVDSDLFATAVRDFADKNKAEWLGSPTDLLAAITPEKPPKGWPLPGSIPMTRRTGAASASHAMTGTPLGPSPAAGTRAPDRHSPWPPLAPYPGDHGIRRTAGEGIARSARFKSFRQLRDVTAARCRARRQRR